MSSGLILYITNNQRRSLNCSVPSPSHPHATITWFLSDVTASNIYNQTNFQAVQATGNTSLMTSSTQVDLIPTLDDDRKNISCSAEHPGLANNLRVDITLRVGDLPDKPTNVTVLKPSVTTSSFTIIWESKSSDEDRETFTVKCCTVLNCTKISNVTQPRLTIADLRPSTVYRVTVMSRNAFGTGNGSDPTEIVTKPLAPSDLGIKAVYDIKENRVDITRPDTRNGPLPFGLCFQLVNATTTTDEIDPRLRIDCVGVGGAVPIPTGWSVGNIKVRSVHHGLSSLPSDIHFNEDKDLFAAPFNVSVVESSITATSFSISWESNASGEMFKTFTVTFCPVNDTIKCTTISKVTQTRLTIAGLQPSTTYLVTVKSQNVLRVSKDSEIVEISTSDHGSK
nr:uncharacterized protein LOC129267254 [Lytechinus pictus]